MQILAISGSLRSASANTTLLRATKIVAPIGIEIVIYEGLGTLPHFNPDDEPGPDSVADFRNQLSTCDGVIICSPEYALDWVVGTSEMVDKPIALINASPRATIAQASLSETLRVMTATLVTEACISLPVSGRKLSDMEIAANPSLAEPLHQAIKSFVDAIKLRNDNI